MLKKSCLIAKFSEKMKVPDFWAKNTFRYFQARILKKYCHIWNRQPRICQIAKIRAKAKLLKFGTKYALFGYFLCWNLKTILLYLELAPSNLANSKIF